MVANPNNRLRRFTAIEGKVVRFLAIAVVAVIGVVALVSYKQGLFITHVPLHFDTPDASGISRGMAVKLFGLQIGTVKDMTIQDNRVRVSLAVGAEHAPQIARGSRIKLVRETFVGGATLHLMPPGVATPGAPTPQEPVVANDSLTYVPSHTVADTLDELKGEVKPLVSDLRGMLKDFSGPDGEYRRYTAAAHDLLAEIRESNKEAHRLLRNADRAMIAAEGAFGGMSRMSAQAQRQLPLMTGKLGTTLDSFGAAATELREAAKKNGEALHEALQQTPKLISSADILVRDGSELVRGGTAMVRDSSDTMRDGREMLGVVRSAWPFRNLIEPPAIVTLPIDSAETGRPMRGQMTPAAAP